MANANSGTGSHDLDHLFSEPRWRIPKSPRLSPPPSSELPTRKDKVVPGIQLKNRFKGKVAIVTESTEGIGLSIANQLVVEGAFVIISSSKESLAAATELFKGKEVELLPTPIHVSNAEHRKNLINKATEKGKGIDVIVCNTAAYPSLNIVLSTQEPILDRIPDTNVNAELLLLKDAKPHLNEGSSVVFVSSAPPNQLEASNAMYNVTKTVLATKALAEELQSKTRVNSVISGLVPPRSSHFTDFKKKIRPQA